MSNIFECILLNFCYFIILLLQRKLAKHLFVLTLAIKLTINFQIEKVARYVILPSESLDNTDLSKIIL